MLALSLALIKACGTGVRLDIAMGVLAVLAVAAFAFARPLVAWNNYLLQFSNYFVFFAMGFIYHRHEHLLYRRHEQHEQHGHSGAQQIVPKPVTALALAACIVLSWRTWPTPIALALSALGVLAIYLLMPRTSCPPLRLISRDSMGIYLFHSPMLYISFTYWPNINPLLMLLINFVGFGTVAILLTELMRRAHLGFVIGE